MYIKSMDISGLAQGGEEIPSQWDFHIPIEHLTKNTRPADSRGDTKKSISSLDIVVHKFVRIF